MTIDGVPYAVGENAVTETMLVELARELDEIPRTSGVPSVQRYLTVHVASFQYRLYANCVNHESADPQVLYYMAHHVRLNRTEYIVAPDQLAHFDDYGYMYMNAAANFHGLTGHNADRRVNIESGMVGWLVLHGRIADAFRYLGRSWLTALQDPDWWFEALLASAPSPGTRPSTPAARQPGLARARTPGPTGARPEQVLSPRSGRTLPGVGPRVQRNHPRNTRPGTGSDPSDLAYARTQPAEPAPTSRTTPSAPRQSTPAPPNPVETPAAPGVPHPISAQRAQAIRQSFGSESWNRVGESTNLRLIESAEFYQAEWQAAGGVGDAPPNGFLIHHSGGTSNVYLRGTRGPR